MLYKPVKVNVPERIHEKLKLAISHENKKNISVKVKLDDGDEGDRKHTLLLTRGQIDKLERARLIGKKHATVRLSSKQVQANLKHEGGFLGMLAALAARVLPTLLGGLATGLVSGAVEKAVSGRGLYLQKRGSGNNAARIQIVRGNGLYITPHPPIVVDGHGLYLKGEDRRVYGGEGLILGPNSPFKNIPLLGLIL